MLLNELFGQAGLNPVLVDDVIVTIWSKFVHNCGINAICALTGLPPGYISQVSELDDLQTKIIEEAAALVRTKGISLPDSDPVRTIKGVLQSQVPQTVDDAAPGARAANGNRRIEWLRGSRERQAGPCRSL